MNKRRGRPKGTPKKMISARLTDNNLLKLKDIENNFGYQKSEIINKAIEEYYQKHQHQIEANRFL